MNPKSPPTAIDPTSVTPMRILQGNPMIAERDTKEGQDEEQGKDAE